MTVGMTGTIFYADPLHLRLWLTALGLVTGRYEWDEDLDRWVTERLLGDRPYGFA